MARYASSPNGEHSVNLQLLHVENGETKDDGAIRDIENCQSDDDDNIERSTWSSKREYLLTCIGYSVGLGNVWRFPYMCQRNGGGAFLIPFLVSLMLCGLPLYFLETSIGQFTTRGAFHVWSFCPIMKGAGIGMLALSVIFFWYYNTIMAWALYYAVASCQSVVPWSRCDGWWNTPNCMVRSANASVGAANDSLSGSSVTMSYLSNVTTGETETNAARATMNISDDNVGATKLVSAAEEFWQHNALQVSSGMGEPGDVVWYLVLALVVSLLFIFCALVKGVKSAGKVVYVTAVAPYVILTVLLVRGATLPGAVDGIIFYLKPDFNRLLEPQVWAEAAVQVFYSLGPGWGVLITMASFNKFHNNCLRDSVLLTFLCEGTSVYGGFAIFAVLGYMANVAGLTIDKVVSSGPGLAFIVYPEAISLMPLPQLWAVLFFVMIVTLAIDTQLGTAETVITALLDFFPRTLPRYRVLVTALFCALFFVAGLPFVTQGGIYVFQLVDWYMATVTIFIVGVMECFGLAWVYGTDRFGDDIELMIGRRPPMIMRIFWCFITPVCLFVILVFLLTRYKPPTYGDYEYDEWASVFGWIIATVSFVPIPVVAVYQLYHAQGSFLQRLRQTTRPESSWGPADAKLRRQYQKELLQKPPRSSCLDIIRR